MAFKRLVNKDIDLELPSIIDVVFLLLIFFLVTIAMQIVGQSKEPGPPQEIFQLPQAKGSEIVRQEEILEHLLIQIENKDQKDPQSPKIVYALWPNMNDSLRLSELLSQARLDSDFVEVPRNILSMSPHDFFRSSPCSLITANVERYKRAYFREPSLENTIEIRAVSNTEFRIINFIMQQCSAYEDTIPKLIFRTISEEERIVGVP